MTVRSKPVAPGVDRWKRVHFRHCPTENHFGQDSRRRWGTKCTEHTANHATHTAGQMAGLFLKRGPFVGISPAQEALPCLSCQMAPLLACVGFRIGYLYS